MDDDSRLIPACAGSTRRSSGSCCCSPAHPRMRGEHLLTSPMFPWTAGSSPHARGARPVHDRQGPARRLIPACAGSTSSPTFPPTLVAAHPRMRGEHLKGPHSARRRPGSSPHARGAPMHRGHRRTLPRLIPACAGSTAGKSGRKPKPTAHPRMRGEHWSVRSRSTDSPGSSPHARGAPGRGYRGSGWLRLIPACAGSTSTQPARVIRRSAHPRMRGEHVHPSGPEPRHIGSSPHARGAHPRIHEPVLKEGLIPACAGSTRTPSRSCLSASAHPRMRGEHARYVFSFRMRSGSSPHARGARMAGLPRGTGSTAHPRMRGEHGPSSSTSVFATGSSPHARGAQAEVGGGPGGGRLIPACAGSTWRPRRCWCRRTAHPRMRGEHIVASFHSRGLTGSSPHARGARR